MAEEIAFENGRISNCERLVTLTLILDRVILHTVVHHSSTLPTSQIYLKSKKLFVDRRTYGQTDGQMHRQTFETCLIRSTLQHSQPENVTVIRKCNTPNKCWLRKHNVGLGKAIKLRCNVSNQTQLSTEWRDFRCTGDVVRVKLVVGDVEKATVLVQIDHLRVHACQTECKLGKAPQCQVVCHLQPTSASSSLSPSTSTHSVASLTTHS